MTRRWRPVLLARPGVGAADEQEGGWGKTGFREKCSSVGSGVVLEYKRMCRHIEG